MARTQRVPVLVEEVDGDGRPGRVDQEAPQVATERVGAAAGVDQSLCPAEVDRLSQGRIRDGATAEELLALRRSRDGAVTAGEGQQAGQHGARRCGRHGEAALGAVLDHRRCAGLRPARHGHCGVARQRRVADLGSGVDQQIRTLIEARRGLAGCRSREEWPLELVANERKYGPQHRRLRGASRAERRQGHVQNGARHVSDHTHQVGVRFLQHVAQIRRRGRYDGRGRRNQGLHRRAGGVGREGRRRHRQPDNPGEPDGRGSAGLIGVAGGDRLGRRAVAENMQRPFRRLRQRKARIVIAAYRQARGDGRFLGAASIVGCGAGTAGASQHHHRRAPAATDDLRHRTGHARGQVGS